MVTMADIVSSRALDPDAQAAVTDFLDYTEYLPADIIRSLTLVRGLDDAYQTTTALIHDLTLAYGTWPAQDPATRPDPQHLRLQISSHLDSALRARDSSFAEASRLYDEVDRHQNRLRSIIAKLKAIPKPPSRDPTPQPPPSTRTKRSRSGRKIETTSRPVLNPPPRGNAVAAALLKRPRGRRVTVPGEVMPPYDPDSPIASTEVSDWDSSPPPPSPPKPVLKLKQLKVPASSQRDRSTIAQDKIRAARETTEPHNRPTPPPEDAAIGSKFKPWTYLTEYELYKVRKKMKKNLSWEPSDVMVKRELADRGRGWENYYRSKALATANGTKFVDLDFVEKVLKPSSDNKVNTDKAGNTRKNEKVDQSESESESSDESDSAEDSSSSEPGDKEQEDDGSSTVGSSAEVRVEKPESTPIQNNITPTVTPATRSRQTEKGRKDSKPHTSSKEVPVKSQAALAAQEAELAARRLGDIGSKFRTLFTTPFASALASLGRGASTPTASPIPGKRSTNRPSRKRKAEETPSASISPSAESDPSRKKQKTVPKPSPLAMSPVSLPGSVSTTTTTTTSSGSEAAPQQIQPVPDTQSAGTIKIPLKLNISSSAAPPSKTPTPAPTTRAASVQRASVVPKTESTPPAPSRPPSRRSAAASVEPQASRRSSRRLSMTPSLAGRRTPGPVGVDGSPKTTAAARRSKRDAPGTLKQSSLDGGAAVSVSKRRTKPVKQTKTTPRSSAALQAENLPQIRVDVDGRQELVDPEEERYCICGDVSWGEMICCELDDKASIGN